MTSFTLTDFVRESNRIEGITREPYADEVTATEQFLAWPELNRLRVHALVKEYQPNARLRDTPGMSVRIGNHIPPPGGAAIRNNLDLLLVLVSERVLSPYESHQRYEALHPFTDGNGRSGRAIWLWQMMHSGSRNEDMALGLGFLHCWYYQSLQAAR